MHLWKVPEFSKNYFCNSRDISLDREKSDAFATPLGFLGAAQKKVDACQRNRGKNDREFHSYSLIMLYNTSDFAIIVQ
jgi:hypothetical protein